MTHEEIQSFLDEYAEGRLPEDLRSEIREHLERCESCRNWFAFISEEKRALSDFSGQDAPDLSDWVSQQEWTRETAVRRSRWNPKRLASVAAALVLIAGLGTIGILSLHPYSASKAAPAAARSIQTADAEEYASMDTFSDEEPPQAAESFAETDNALEMKGDMSVKTVPGSDQAAAEEPAAPEPFAEADGALESNGDVSAKAVSGSENAASDEGTVFSAEYRSAQDGTGSAGQDPANGTESAQDSEKDEGQMMKATETGDPTALRTTGQDPAPRRSGLLFTLVVLAVGLIAVLVWRIRKAKEYGGR